MENLNSSRQSGNRNAYTKLPTPQDIVKRLASLYILLVLYYGLRSAVIAGVISLIFNEDNFISSQTSSKKPSDIVFS